ncbi:hypothetical protein RirG_027240 [Rhizophagus irregularis DAOM 197198w]|uniref:Uncharacterized protein n=1 Tax=Rhizophagus irregularis (strain DAOM 197198w) TaxID=1432141 RepID=A0A015K5K7_RHIIW|nr:hypothetical protein RirG_027240 [Rhizophagus irregularis DAOM 197198w]
MQDQAEINVKVLEAVHASGSFATSAGQSSSQCFVLLAGLLKEASDEDVAPIIENFQEMLDASKKLIQATQDIANLIARQHKEMRERLEKRSAAD